jgi:hypothetical protein
MDVVQHPYRLAIFDEGDTEGVLGEVGGESKL